MSNESKSPSCCAKKGCNCGGPIRDGECCCGPECKCGPNCDCAESCGCKAAQARKA